MKKHQISFVLGLASVLVVAQAWAAGDAKKGADVFAEECGDCHSVVAGKQKKPPACMASLAARPGRSLSFPAIPNR
jgi:cytochrome c